MSFYNSRQAAVYPGPIAGDALCGLRHRVAVSVERVLDSCIKQGTAENVRLCLCDISPPNPSPPFKFVGAHSLRPAAIVSDVSIARLKERPEFARVKCTVTIPLRVDLEDLKGEQFTAESRISVAEDVVLFVPKNSIFPFEVKATAAITDASASGKISDDSVTASICYTIITKIIADTDLMIPCYGFCPTPHAVDFEKCECNEFFDLPLYPSGKG